MIIAGQKKGISKEQWRQMKALPIYVTEQPKHWQQDWNIDYSYWEGMYPVTSMKAKTLAPQASYEFFETVKEYPGVVKDIKKAKPKALIYSSAITGEQEGGWTHKQKVFIRPKFPETQRTKTEVERWIRKAVPVQRRTEVRKQLIERVVYPEEDKPLQARKKKLKGIAEHIHHELTHVRQERTLGAREMERQQKAYNYWNAPFEREARQRAERQLLGIRLDTDRDGVIDALDCRPFDPTRQDAGFVSASIDRSYEDSRQVINMNPEEYLKLALPNSKDYDRFDERAYDKGSLENLRNRMKKELEIDPPSFTIDLESGSIIGHSGRHRAFTAWQLGFETIPVVIYYKYAGTYAQKYGMKVPQNMQFKSELEGLSYKRRR